MLAYDYKEVEEGKSMQLDISGKLCYTCWYFIYVIVQDKDTADYRITIN